NGNLNVSNPKFNYIAVVPGGNHSLRLDGSFDDTPVGGYRYNSPCNYPFGAGPTGYDFMGQMITGAQQIGITGERSANADSVFEFINRVLTPVRMNMHDTINGSVFEKINSASVPVNCATGQPFILDLGSLGQFQQGSTEVIGPPATAKELHSEVLLVPENVRVCVNFNAKIRADASSQLHAINTASNNYVRFYNIFNQVISNSSVNSGTISVQGAGDLDIVEFWLTDSTGTRKSNFKSDEAIYVHVKIRNIGAGPVNAGADTSIWKKGNLGVGVSSDIPMYFN